MSGVAGLHVSYDATSVESSVNMSTTLGGFPRDEYMSGAIDIEKAQGDKFKFTWQELGPADRYASQQGWQQSQVPIVLESLPEHVLVSQQLQNILIWSLRRFEELTPEAASMTADPQVDKAGGDVDNTQQITPTEIDTEEVLTSSPKADGSERSTTSSTVKSRRARPLLSRLRQLRQDVAAKVASRGQHPSGTSRQAFEIVTDAPRNGECISCFEECAKADLVRLACSHDYCKQCARELILNATKTESAFPPKCCLTEIPLKTVLACLDNKQRDEYKEKAAEYAIPAGHRWYCPEPKCSKWIRPEKLHRERRSHQTCPHCKSKVCSICRSLAHDGNEDCPQDFGLESTLEVGESEGWRRCYSCRTMVELTTGCRHITCRCGAEFCYVCNARWRTCHCTEADKERRIAELRTQRQERDQRQQEVDAAAQAEAAEIAQAIAQIEEMERQEAIQLAEEERQRQLEEELMLARLEEARLLEEIAKREAEEEAEKVFRQTLLESSKEECRTLMSTLMQIINFQHAALMSKHEADQQSCIQEKSIQQATALSESSTMASWLQENISKQTQTLHTRQREEWEQLLRQAEEEEDDMFMQMHMYLRDKPNREQREKRMRDTFQQQQQEKQAALQIKHEDERRRLELSTQYENEGLQRAQSIRLEPVEEQFHSSLRQLGWEISCDRQWFQLVSTRRIEMLKEHKRLVLEQLEAEQDPVGLTEERARHIGPTLPAIPDGRAESAGIDSVDGQDANQLAHCEPAQPPCPLPPETTDRYSPDGQDAPDDPATPVEQTCSPLTPPSITSCEGAPQLARSGTIICPIPGAYPTSTTIATPSSKRSKGHYLNAFEPSPTKPPKPVTKRKPLPSFYNVRFSPVFAGNDIYTAPRKDAGSTSTSTSTTTSPSTRLTSATTTDTERTSRISTTLADPGAALQARIEAGSGVRKVPSWTDSANGKDRSFFSKDNISATVDVGRVPGSNNSTNGKGRSFLSKFGRRKEISEEEIRRRMSGCVGDGFGV